MFDIEKIEINAAFYELFESVFGEDFFTVLASIRPSGRIQALRARATKLVKEEDAVMRHRYLTGTGIRSAAYESRHSYGMMG